MARHRQAVGASRALRPWLRPGTLARPYIANAAATTATVWWVQGFAEEEDISFKKIVADYEKASGNTIDYTITPYAPMRQKIVSAMTSGAVPDLFKNNPVEIIALYAWDDKLVDVSDVVATQQSQYTETALLTANCYNNVEKRRSFYGVPYTVAVSTEPYLAAVGREGRLHVGGPARRPGMRSTISSRRCRRNCAPRAMRNVYAIGFQLNTTGNDSEPVVRLFPDRLWRAGHRHQ